MCAPAIVRVGSLMPVRGIILPTERHWFGSVIRMYVFAKMPTITKLQNAGLTAYEIAAEFNRRQPSYAAAWDAQRVMYVIERDEMIRREDAIRRAELVFAARHADPQI